VLPVDNNIFSIILSMEFTITNGVEVMKQFSRTDRIREIFEKMPKTSKKDLFDSYFEHYNDDTDTASVRATINSQVPKIMEAKEFLNKALNLDENPDTKFSVYLTKNKQHLKNYLEDYVFNIDAVKKHFIDTLKMYISEYEISFSEEDKFQIKKLNELDLDKFVEIFASIVQIIFINKIISKIKSPEGINEEYLNKVSKIFKEFNEDSLNHIVELSSNAIKELHPKSDRNNGSSTELWSDIPYHRDNNHRLHNIEKHFSELIKNGKYKKLLETINKIIKKAKDLMNNHDNDVYNDDLEMN